MTLSVLPKRLSRSMMAFADCDGQHPASMRATRSVTAAPTSCLETACA
jgi:hypothetical protein